MIILSDRSLSRIHGDFLAVLKVPYREHCSSDVHAPNGSPPDFTQTAKVKFAKPRMLVGLALLVILWTDGI